MDQKNQSVELHLYRIKIKNSSIFSLPQRNETGKGANPRNILRFYCDRYLRQFSIILSRTPIRFALSKYFSPTNGALSPSRNNRVINFRSVDTRAGPCVSHNGGSGKRACRYAIIVFKTRFRSGQRRYMEKLSISGL